MQEGVYDRTERHGMSSADHADRYGIGETTVKAGHQAFQLGAIPGRTGGVHKGATL